MSQSDAELILAAAEARARVPIPVEGQVVGAVGVSSGSTDEDHEVAEAGGRAFYERYHLAKGSGTGV